MLPTTRKLIAALACVSFVAAACGGDDDADPTTPPTETTADSEAPEPTEAPDDSAAPADSSAPATAIDSSEAPGSTVAAPGTTAGEPSDAVSGGSLKIAIASDYRTLDPISVFMSGALDGTQAAAVYDTLFRTADDGSFVPRLATSLESDDFVTWTMTLREGVTFTDGTDFDAEAVKFNWERQADPENAARGASAANQMTDITVVDAHTLTFTLEEANARFVDLLKDQLGLIASPTALQAPDADFANFPVGAGPFIVSERQPDVETTFTRNPDFWDAPRPYVDEVVMTVVSDPNQRMNSLKTEAVNGAFYVSASSETAELAEEGWLNVNRGNVGGGGFIVNTLTPGLDDVRLRRALQIGLDTELLSELSSDGASRVVTTMFPEDSRYYTAEPSVLAYDPAAAQTLIDEVVAETGGPISLRMLFSAPLRLQAEAAIQQWSQYDGITFEPTLVDSVGPDIVAGNFDLVVGSLSGADPFGLFDVRLRSDGSQNYGKWVNTALDEALAEAKVTDDETRLTELYATISEQVFEEVPMILAFQSEFQYFFDTTVQDAEQYHYAILDLPALWIG